ncbi:unnamed protein product, partial [Ectocarpus sp. 12 AP-2014]
ALTRQTKKRATAGHGVPPSSSISSLGCSIDRVSRTHVGRDDDVPSKVLDRRPHLSLPSNKRRSLSNAKKRGEGPLHIKTEKWHRTTAAGSSEVVLGIENRKY